MRPNRLFRDDGVCGSHSWAWISSFTLDNPLAIATHGSVAGWGPLREMLLAAYKKSSDFHVPSLQTWGTDVMFPSGEPLELRLDGFIDAINFRSDLVRLGANEHLPHCQFDDLAWVCPSGIVLIMWRISTDNEKAADALGRILSRGAQDTSAKYNTADRYTELSLSFIRIARTLVEVLPPPTNSGTHSKRLRRAMEMADQLCPEIGGAWCNSQHAALEGAAYINKDFQGCLYDLLLDVYDLAVAPHRDHTREDFQIRYTDALLQTTDRCQELTIAVAYHGFPAFIWMKDYLNGELERLQRQLALVAPVTTEQLVRIRLLRIFIERLINGAQPINIRLTQDYLVPLEAFWHEERLDLLAGQIRHQLETLDKIVDSLEAVHAEHRNLRIGIAAILISGLSISAVVAQLISTLDAGPLPRLECMARAGWIILGTTLGVSATLAAFVPWKHRRKDT